MRLLHFVFLTLLVAVTAPVLRAATLVQDGRPAASIVVRDSAFKAEAYQPQRALMGTPDAKIKLAALDLQNTIEKMSGAKLPLVSDAQPVQGTVVLVGPSSATEKVKGLTVPSGLTSERKEEGYVIFARGSTLVLAGNDAGPFHGTHCAVAEFLNRQGVRWIMPGDFGEVVPAKPTISFGDTNFTERPGFRFRTWWCNQPIEMQQVEALWKLRNKIQLADTDVISIPGDSHLRSYMPDAELAKTKPEVFGRTFDGQIDYHMPNLSNPEAARLVADKVIAAIRKAAAAGKPIHSLGFAPDDGRPMDFTPETIKKLNQGFTDLTGREGVPTEMSTSEEWFYFMNQVTAHVVKEFPDFIVTTNGYANRSLPPEGIKLHPNLGLMTAFIWADTTKPVTSPLSWQGQLQAGQLKRWTEMNSRVFLYEYNLTMLVSLLTPLPQVQKTAINYSLYKKWGMMGFFNETRQPFMEEGIATRYMRAKLMWNPDLDLQATWNDYNTSWYGPAAQPAASFWKAIEDALLASPMLGHEDRILPLVYTPALLATLNSQAAAAERLATAEPYRTRVRVDRLTLQHLEEYMAYKNAEFDGKWAEAVKHLDNMVERRIELNKISPFLAMPPSRGGVERLFAGENYWGVLDRRDYFQKLHDMTSGVTGELVAVAPKNARFTLDEASMGHSLRWFEPDYNRSGWRQLDTTKPFYTQGYMSRNGVPYTGKMWYVFEVDVPAAFKGKPVRIHSPFVTTQPWAWVNGEYAGTRGYLEAYWSPAPLDVDVTRLVKPGKNIIAVQVGTGANQSQATDGFLGRLFLYSPKDPAKTLPTS